MVRVALPRPDPRRRISPTQHTLGAGTDLFRIYDPAALHGPRDGARFRWRGPYGLTLSCAVVEAFDIGIVEPGTKLLARARATRDLLLLDLRGRAAMRSGTVAAISAGDHSLSQPWSRYFWEHPEIYGELDGLLYPSAHNGEPAVALYERGRAGIEVPSGRDAPLTDPAVLAALRRVALDHRLIVLPPP